ncbi:unnamed protein product, partial [marine sediment metagenome]
MDKDHHIFPKENISKNLSIYHDEEYNLKVSFIFTQDF